MHFAFNVLGYSGWNHRKAIFNVFEGNSGAISSGEGLNKNLLPKGGSNSRGGLIRVGWA